MEKSYVTLETCPICGGDTGLIILDGHIQKRFEHRTINPGTTCEDCKKKYLAEGVMLINPKTGTLAVVKETAFQKMFSTPVPKGRIAFAEEGLIKALIKSGEEANCIDAEIQAGVPQ